MDTYKVKRHFWLYVVVYAGSAVLGLHWLVQPVQAQAATLSLSPAAGSYRVGQTFSVNVLVSSPDQAMNATSGRVDIPVDLVDFVGVSRAGSVVNLWVQDPSFTNGEVRFEGIVLNPGFKGGATKVISITVKAKAAGVASFGFAAGSVLANDGKGTNILTGMSGAEFRLQSTTTAPIAAETTSPVEAVGVPVAPQVSSPTHSDPNKWYTNSNPEFRWTLPPGTLGVNVLADHEPTTNPGTKSDGLRSSYTYTNVDDGVWYFHLRLQNARGWGAVSHFKFQIDTQKPAPFSIKFVDGRTSTSPSPTVLFDTTDQPSGIDFYRVKVGDSSSQLAQVSAVPENPYTLPAQLPGKHTILVQAVDRAGNYFTDSQDFEITPLDQPQLTDYPSELAPGDAFTVRGATYPRATVRLTLTPESGQPGLQESTSDAAGKFTIAWPKALASGPYQWSVTVVDSRGAESVPTSPQSLLVREQPLLRIGRLAVGYLNLLVTLAALLLALMVVVSFGYIKLRRLRRVVQADAIGAEQVLHRSFRSLQAEAKSLLRLLNRARTKRELTLEEEKIDRQLQKALSEAEQTLGRKIEGIEKDVKK